MKAYKIKSLIYLSIFIAAAAVYHHMEQNQMLQDTLSTSSVADLEVEQTAELEAEDDTKE